MIHSIGEYLLVSSERNELAFTIKGDKGTIDAWWSWLLHNQQRKRTLKLTGGTTSDSTVKYKYKDGIITVNITGVERDYYQKNSNAYKEALKQFNYK